MMPKAPSNVRRELRDLVNRLVRAAEEKPVTVYTNAARSGERRKWGNSEEKKLLLLKAERQALGEELKVHPSLIATNAVLEIIACKNPRSAAEIDALGCLLPWQVEFLSERALKITTPTIDDKRLI